MLYDNRGKSNATENAIKYWELYLDRKNKSSITNKVRCYKYKWKIYVTTLEYWVGDVVMKVGKDFLDSNDT